MEAESDTNPLAIPAALLAELQAEAAEERRSAQDVLQDAVTRYVKAKRWQRTLAYGQQRVKALGLTEADVARQLFDGLGLGDRTITYENRSRTTYENVQRLKALLGPQPGQTWLLITSAWHMPRSMGLFQHVGWSVIPYPVGYKTGPGWVMAFRGSFPDRLGLVDLAAHEWVGLTAYWLLGRTASLFPAPQASTPR